MEIPQLLSTTKMVSVSASRASESNEWRASRQLAIVAAAHGMDDPKSVSKESSRLVLNIHFSYVEMNDSDGSKILGKDSMTALIEGLQKCYDK
jgi:hypothetical protein